MERKHFDLKQRTCRCHFDETEERTKPGLSISPAQMRKMNEMGIPVSTSNKAMAFESGHEAKSFEVPPENRRGVDMADLYQIQQSARKKLVNIKSQRKNQ